MPTLARHASRRAPTRRRDPYFYLPFDVPEGTTRIDVTLAYPKAEDCIIDLGCLDPRITAWPSREGFRGWSGGARDRFFVATDDATPGYVHGPIPPGEWQVILGLYKLPPAGAEVTRHRRPRRRARAPPAPQPERTLPGARRRRLVPGRPALPHLPLRRPRRARAAARRRAPGRPRFPRRHRPQHHHPAALLPPASSPDLVFVRGMEVTTAAGHANVYGVDDWIDFRMTRPSDAHILARPGPRARAACSRSTTTSRPSPGTTSCPTPTAWRSGSRPGRPGTGSRSPASRTGSPRACASPRSAAATSTSRRRCCPKGRSSSPGRPPCSGSTSSPRTRSSPR